MRQIFVIFSVLLMTMWFNQGVFSQTTEEGPADLDLDFKIEEVEKKPYSVNADIEAKETIRFFDQNALLFRQKYLDEKQKNTISQTDLDLTIEGRYQKDTIKLYGRFNGLFYYNDDEKWESEEMAEEAYISFQPSFSLAMDAGKKVHKWGKGYAFSPSAFFSRPKDLDDPDATLEGYYSLSADYIKSMDGIIKTIAVTPVLIPVTRKMNDEIGSEDELIWGGKFYFFAFDTDMDFMFLISHAMDNRFGMDFSKNISPSLEIHGDAAWVQTYQRYIIDEDGNTGEIGSTALNLLLGLRYLSSRDTTYIFEFYRNGQGYSGGEYEDYLALIENGFDQYVNTSNPSLISKSKTYAAHYNRQTAMRNYLYLKISQKDPFDILYFVPAISVVYNMQDQSASITPQFTYTPLTNFTIDLKTGVLLGGSKTEYGEKINTAKAVLSLKYYF